MLAAACLVSTFSLLIGSAPQIAIAAKSIDIGITPSVFYFSEGNDLDFDILIENHSNESLSFSISGTLRPDMQPTSFAGNNIQNHTSLVLKDTVTTVTQNFNLHWQGNWVFEVEVDGYNQSGYKTISNSSRYWLYIHSSTEQFQKSQVQVTERLATYAGISAAIAAASAGLGFYIARSANIRNDRQRLDSLQAMGQQRILTQQSNDLTRQSVDLARQEQAARLRPLLAITSAQNFYHSTKDKMRLQVVLTNMGSVPATNVRVSYWETKHENVVEIIQERSQLSPAVTAVGTRVQGTDSLLEHMVDWPKSKANGLVAVWIEYSYLGAATGKSAAVLYLQGSDGPVIYRFFADDEFHSSQR